MLTTSMVGGVTIFLGAIVSIFSVALFFLESGMPAQNWFLVTPFAFGLVLFACGLSYLLEGKR